MQLIKHLLFEQYKNFRILLRNISSLLLLIIGPLALILLVGYAYSGVSLHDINIGVMSSNYSALEPAFQNFSSFANIIHYGKTDDCTSDLRLYKTHVCLQFSDDFGKIDTNNSDFVSGTITFYYDNSRKPLSNKVVEVLSDYFGVEAEKISIESARSIFGDIQDFVKYVESKNKDLLVMVNESENVRLSLIERHDRLVEMRSEFLPVYDQIKYVQAQLDNVSQRLDEDYVKYNRSYAKLDSELRLLRSRLKSLDALMPSYELYLYLPADEFKITDNLSFLSQNNLSYYNLRKYNYSVNLEQMSLNISNLENYPSVLVNLSELGSPMRVKLSTRAGVDALGAFEEVLANFSGTTEDYYNYLSFQKKQFDVAVGMIDDVRVMLDTDISMTEEYIQKIDVAVVKVRETQGELNSTVRLFSRFSPGMAEKLIKPFLKNYEPILPNIDNITQAYPGMIAIIVIFISILFANIVTLTEINSKAFYRNLLAPVNKLIFIFGLIISIITIVFFQIFVLLLVGQLNFGIDVFGVIGSLAAVIGLLALLFIIIGMIISILIRSEQSSVLTTTFVALAFFLFSDSVTPIEIMPKLAGFFASHNPYVIATLAFKKIIIFGMGLPLIANELMLLGIYLLVALAILVFVSQRRLKN